MTDQHQPPRSTSQNSLSGEPKPSRQSTNTGKPSGNEIAIKIEATKRDTTEILAYVRPTEAGADPLLPLLRELIEITMRTESKLDQLMNPPS
ncbi:hypothetical protein CLV78_105216 [Aliiruegeria haliotis]|uniref:Uncharacterized protein n=1 Tax=Aliiruegeria haliotis TaxID=1280846 RepID=A0A2T0RPU6_9RHOB|nr:hypothetical protein CLV78_105216 [Aliiruegeria haliotis]